MVAVGVTGVVPFVPTLPTPWSILHEVAPEDDQESVTVSGGTMGPFADDVKETMLTGGGGTQEAWHCAWVVDVGVPEMPQEYVALLQT